MDKEYEELIVRVFSKIQDRIIFELTSPKKSEDIRAFGA